MTVATSISRNDYSLNAGSLIYPYTFRTLRAEDLRVIVRSAVTGAESVLSYPFDYSVSGVGNPSGGSVTLTAVPTTGDVLTIKRAPSAVQQTSFRAQGQFFPETHEDAFDLRTMLEQYAIDALGRSPRVKESYAPSTLSLDLVPETGKVLAWQSPTQLGNSTLDSSAVALPANGRTVTTLSAYLANNAVANLRDYGCIGNGITDDTAKFKVALANGKYVVGNPADNYLVSSFLPVNQSGQSVLGNGGKITTSGVGTSAFAVGNNGSNVFVKTDDILIDGWTFVGASDASSGSQTASAIAVQGPSGLVTDPYVEGQGCSRITVRNCRESNFCFGFSATGADRVRIVDFTIGGNKEITFAGPSYAGGYGVLLQSCFRVVIDRLVGTAGPLDRHAIYLSRDSTRNVNTAGTPGLSVLSGNICKDIQIINPDITWHDGTVVTGLSGFEAAIECRSPWYVTLRGGIIRGGYGGFEYDCTVDGDGKNVKVLGTQFLGQLSLANSRHCVFVGRSSGAFTVNDVTVQGCTIEPTGAITFGIFLLGVTNINVSGNVGKNVNSQSLVNVAGSVVNAYFGGNTWNDNAGYCYSWSGTGNDAILMGRDQITLSGGGLVHSWTTTPTNFRFGYSRTAVLTASGAGAYTVSSDLDAIVTSFTTDANGLAVTLSANAVAPSTGKVRATLINGGTAFQARVSAVAGQVATVTIQNQAGTLLPGNVNAESVLLEVTG